MSLRPHSCQSKSLNEYYTQKSSANDQEREVCSSADLLVAVNFALQNCNTTFSIRQISTVLASDLASSKESAHGDDARTTTVEWNTVDKIPVRVRSIEDSVRFSHDKTYWFAGLVGGLGLSLCEWMTARGAKNIVITSRSPKIGEAWTRSMAALGAEGAVLACDLTSKEQTTAIYNKIASSMPPLGGVAQGAMVLQDTGFRDMSPATMAKVLGLKVTGSINLDGLVQDLNLEFFVFFSSATATLEEATTVEQVFTALKDVFLPALCALFQLDSALAGDALFLEERLERFGLDSLLAVETRMWWLSTLQANIPVMKILSGVTVRDIINFGVASLSPDLVPNLKDQEDATEAGEAEEEDTNDQALQKGHQTESKYVRPLPPVIRSMDMSFNQQMHWFGLTSTQDKSVLNHTARYRIRGELNVDDFERAVLHLGQVHDTLRTCFRAEQGHTSMGIVKSSTLRVQREVIASEAEVETFVRNVQATAYDLERAETMRIFVLSLSPTEHYLVSGSHSLVLDGLSSVVFLREFAHLYQNYSSLDEADVYQHSDCVSAQREAYKSGALNESIDFWKACWASPPAPLPTLRISQFTSRSWLGGYDNVRAEAVISPCTGDVGRWLEDGTLVVEGRKAGDTQVKLRGLRIDLAEVEHCLLKESQGALVQVFVTPRHIGQHSGQPDDRVLVAQAEFTTEAFSTHDERQAFLNELIARLPLPQYMRPAAAYPVAELPMLISGELDRKAVAELPLEQQSAADDEQPRNITNNMPLTQTDSLVKSLWETCVSSEILKQYNIEPSTDFFHIGGNSTLLMKLQYKIRKELGVSLSLMDMFEHTTLGAMARRIDPDGVPPSDSSHEVDWTAETNVPESLMKAIPLARSVKTAPPRVVVMTGASDVDSSAIGTLGIGEDRLFARDWRGRYTLGPATLCRTGCDGSGRG